MFVQDYYIKKLSYTRTKHPGEHFYRKEKEPLSTQDEGLFSRFYTVFRRFCLLQTLRHRDGNGNGGTHHGVVAHA